MELQLIGSLLLVGVAFSYLIWSAIRPWMGRGKPGCGGCGSCGNNDKDPGTGATTFVPIGELTVRGVREGERP